MQSNGFYFSLEAMISLTLIIIVFLTPAQEFDSGFKEVFVNQKMHDLLLVWAKQRNFSQEELREDFEFVFPNKSGSIEIGGNTIEIGLQKFRGTKFVESANYIGNDFKFKKITLTVFD